MDRFLSGNVFLVLSMLSAASAQVLIKRLLIEINVDSFDSNTFRALMEGTRPWRGATALVMIVVGFGFWILCLGRLNLSYAYPIACTSVLLVSLLSIVFLDEVMSLRMWFGTFLILGGVVLLMPRA